jgi:hypothetical protein
VCPGNMLSCTAVGTTLQLLQLDCSHFTG